MSLRDIIATQLKQWARDLNGYQALKIPDVAEAAIGFRVWTVTKLHDGPYLHSNFASGELWPTDNPIVAKCKRHAYNTALSPRGVLPTHEAPIKKCSCGIYLAANLARPLEYAHDGRKVYGIAYGFGKGVPTQEGWRVKLAQPAALFDFTDAPFRVLEILPHTQHRSSDWTDYWADYEDRIQSPNIGLANRINAFTYTKNSATLLRIAQRYDVPIITPWSTRIRDYREGARDRFATTTTK